METLRVDFTSSLRLERELRAVSVNCYVQTSPVVHWCSRPPPCAASLLVSSDTSRASDNTERETEAEGEGKGWRVSRKLGDGIRWKNRVYTLGLAGTWNSSYVRIIHASREGGEEREEGGVEERRDFKIQDKSYFSHLTSSSCYVLLHPSFPLFRPCCVTAFGLATVVITWIK